MNVAEVVIPICLIAGLLIINAVVVFFIAKARKKQLSDIVCAEAGPLKRGN